MSHQHSPAPLSPALRAALGGLRITDGTPRVEVDDDLVVAADTWGELRSALAGLLYERWHAGIVHQEGPARMPRRSETFERELIAATGHTRTVAPGVLRSPVEAADGGPDAPVRVELGRVLVGVRPGAVRSDGPPAVGRPCLVELPAVRPALSPGFLLVDGPDGSLVRAGELLRLYVHLAEPGAAPPVWRALLERLAGLGVRYRAKVLSRPWSYPRRDAAVVYLDAADAAVAPMLADTVAGLPGVAGGASVFASPLCPGVALAWEPRDERDGWGGRSFGQHRAAAVADGVVRRATDPAGPSLEEQVARALREASASPAEPARNLGSPALPAPAAPDAEVPDADVPDAEAPDADVLV
ncbi:T3SS effector HopA1 family protein [Kitasatospora sp. NPDC058048]|uniref:T3SS effector HopA1 family protein n=1 Tax=Kitasatospora sp. NPDC058048 TaxID=3346313 RepID=UPI0036DE5A64